MQVVDTAAGSSTGAGLETAPPVVTGTTFAPLVGTRVLQGIVALALILRVAYAVVIPPNSGEAYYWLWGQHLQWSYLDHGPLVGWTSALSGIVGWSIFAMRLPTLLTTALVLWVFWVWSDRLVPRQRVELFWVLSAIYLTSPLMAFVSYSMYPDHVLVPLVLLAVHFLCLFLADWRSGAKASVLDLYLGAGFMGLAGLAKYNAIFLGLGLAVAIVLDPRLRGLLRSVHLYLAGLLTQLIVSPIFFWNAAYGFPTVHQHAADRFAGRGEFTLEGLVQVGGGLLMLSPFLMWPLIRFLFAKGLTGPLRELQGLTTPMFVLSTGLMLALASWSIGTGQVQERWNLLACLPFMLAVPFFIRSRWLLWGHLAVGSALLVLVSVFYFATPMIETAFGGKPREPQRFGVEQLSAAALAAGQSHAVDFYAALDWSLTSRFAFAMGPGPVVTWLNPGNDQFDLWFPGSSLAGKSAIVVIHGATDAKELKLPFDQTELLKTVEVTRFGVPVGEYSLVLGRGYHPSPSWE